MKLQGRPPWLGSGVSRIEFAYQVVEAWVAGLRGAAWDQGHAVLHQQCCRLASLQVGQALGWTPPAPALDFQP